MRKFIILILSALTMISCASQKNVQKEEVLQDSSQPANTTTPTIEEIKITQAINANLNNIYGEADVALDFPQMSQSVDMIIKIASYDSAYIRIKGPLGISVAKLFSTPNYFLFLNQIKGKAFEGSPTPEKLAQFLNTTLTYKNISDLFRGKLVFDYTQYKFVETQKGLNKFEYKKDNLIDVAIVDSNNAMKSYSRRDNGKDILRINYEYTANNNDKNLIKTMTIILPMFQGKIVIKYDRFYDSFNTKEPFKFTLHKNIKVQKVD